ncbi:MAG: indole-3-glycerol phosphate synthase TrpC [Planctomycetota bacterium]|nr:indole-3-glycerol phosphate synthase TrpC [Planctomycetota bacterium]
MISVLKDIVARKFNEVERAREAVPVEVLKERIAELGRPRNFFQAVVDRRHPNTTHIIAEIKRKSPSAGVIREDFDPVAIAKAYAANGASAISCLTDEHDFGGRLEYIHAVRDAVKLPVLRKDFIVDLYQVWESRAAGADAILLIAEALPERDIIDFQILATELGMTTLIEVHDVVNLLRIVNIVGFPHASYSLLGINNRNLRTMKTSIEHSMRLAEMLEDTSVLVSESGIRTPQDLARLRAHGIHIARGARASWREGRESCRVASPPVMQQTRPVPLGDLFAPYLLVTSWYPLVPGTKQAHPEKGWNPCSHSGLRARPRGARYVPARTRSYPLVRARDPAPSVAPSVEPTHLRRAPSSFAACTRWRSSTSRRPARRTSSSGWRMRTAM